MSLAVAAALPSFGKKETLVFMHFPPVWNGNTVVPILDVLCEFGVRRCFYGHIHGNYTTPSRIEHCGIEFSLVSADYLDFIPHIILPQ